MNIFIENKKKSKSKSNKRSILFSWHGDPNLRDVQKIRK